MAYIPLRKAVEFLGLHPNTLRKYADEGQIKSIKNGAGQRLYNGLELVVTSTTQLSNTCSNQALKPIGCQLKRKYSIDYLIGQNQYRFKLNLLLLKTIQDYDGNQMNRDLNSVRGIFLRASVDTPWLKSFLVI
jgi:hypothetical protein